MRIEKRFPDTGFRVDIAGVVGILEIVADKIWTAEELEAMTPAEQDAIFESSLITDPSQVPEAFLERVRRRTRQIAGTEPRTQ